MSINDDPQIVPSFDAIWNALLDGDPGPALALATALIDNDMSFAAGGFLRDLAERIQPDSLQLLADDAQRQSFDVATRQALLEMLDGNHVALEELLAECD